MEGASLPSSVKTTGLPLELPIGGDETARELNGGNFASESMHYRAVARPQREREWAGREIYGSRPLTFSFSLFFFPWGGVGSGRCRRREYSGLYREIPLALKVRREGW